MKLRKAFAIFLPFICIFLFSCGIQDYPTYTYELANRIGEKYLINYCEQTNYPDNNTRVKVFVGKKKIVDYNGGNYSGCNSYTPSQIMLICSSDKVDYYYMKTQLNEFIVADGMLDIKMAYNMFTLGKSKDEMNEDEKRTYLKLSGLIRASVSRENAEKRFSDCGFNSASFMTFYDNN